MRCWGYNSHGQTTVPADPFGPPATPAVSLSVAPASVAADGSASATVTVSGLAAGQPVQIGMGAGSVGSLAQPIGSADGAGRFVTTIRSAAPQLAAGADGRLMALWRRNAAGLLSGDAASPDQIQVAFYDAGWGAPATAVAAIPGLGELGGGIGSGTATIALTRALAATGATTPAMQLFTSSWAGASWSAPAQLSDDTLGHRTPQVVYNAANQPRQRDLFLSVYDGALGQWGQPRRLTSDVASEGYVAPAFDASGQLLIGYAATAIGTQQRSVTPAGASSPLSFSVPVEGQTDMVALSRPLERNLALAPNSLRVAESHPAPGASVQISATVSNTGDLALGGVAVAFYDGDPGAGGSLLGSQALAAGMTATLSLAYLVPTHGGAHTLYAVVDPSNTIVERDEADNQDGLAAFGPDREVRSASAQYLSPTQVGLVAVVANAGSAASPATQLRYTRDTADGALMASAAVANNVTVGVYRRWALDAPARLATQTIPTIPAGGYAEITVTVGGPLGCGVYVYIDPARTLAERSRANNLAVGVGDGGICSISELFLPLIRR